jgi:hypothetical protein
LRSRRLMAKASLACESEERRQGGQGYWVLAGTPGTPRLPLSRCTICFLITMSLRSTTADTRPAAVGRALRAGCANSRPFTKLAINCRVRHESNISIECREEAVRKRGVGLCDASRTSEIRDFSRSARR